MKRAMQECREWRPSNGGRLHVWSLRALVGRCFSSGGAASRTHFVAGAAHKNRCPSSSSSSTLIQSCDELARTGTAYHILCDHVRTKNWLSALQILQAGCTLASPIAKPRADEQMNLMESIPSISSSIWATALLYENVLRRCCALNPPCQRVVAKMLDVLRRRGALRAAELIGQRDLDAVWSGRAEMTNDASRAVLALHAAGGNWLEATNLVAQRPNLQSSPNSSSLLVGVIARSHSTTKALEVLHTLRAIRVAALTDPSVIPHERKKWETSALVLSPNIALLGAIKRLPGDDSFSTAKSLLAAILATGSLLELPAFIPLAEMMNKRGMWADTLSILAHRFHIFDDGLRRQIPSVLAVVRRALLEVNPYYDVSTAEFITEVASALDPTRRANSLSPKHCMQFPRSLHTAFGAYTVPLSNALHNAYFSQLRMFHGDMAIVVKQATEDKDAIIVLDTNLLLHLALRNMALSTFITGVRSTYPHLKDRPLRNIIVPYTAIHEAMDLVWNRGRRRLAVRRALWSRVVALVKGATVLSFSSEFPTVAFQLITSMAMRDVAVRHRTVFHGHRNPDESIINCLLLIQSQLRYLKLAESLHGGASMKTSRGSIMSAFIRFHTRRLLGQMSMPGSDLLVLLTFDKELSRRADCLGIDTFPRFVGADSRCRR